MQFELRFGRFQRELGRLRSAKSDPLMANQSRQNLRKLPPIQQHHARRVAVIPFLQSLKQNGIPLPDHKRHIHRQRI